MVVKSCSLLFQLDNLADPLELLTYLGPSDTADGSTPTSSSSGNQCNSSTANTNTSTSEDILSFFES